MPCKVTVECGGLLPHSLKGCAHNIALAATLTSMWLTLLPLPLLPFLQGERRPKRRRKQLHDLSGVGSVGIVARGPLDEYRFNMFMRDLLAEKAKDIFRCKGVLAVHVSGVLVLTCPCVCSVLQPAMTAADSNK